MAVNRWWSHDVPPVSHDIRFVCQRHGVSLEPRNVFCITASGGGVGWGWGAKKCCLWGVHVLGAPQKRATRWCLPAAPSALTIRRRVGERTWWTAGTTRGGAGPHAHGNTARQVVDGLRTEVWGQQQQSNEQPAQPQHANYWAPLTRKRHILPHPAQPQHPNHWAP